MLLLGLLSSPISWDHYGPFLIPVAASILATWPRLRPPTRFVLVASAVCLLGASDLRLVGFLVAGTAPFSGMILCWGLLLALLALLMRGHAPGAAIALAEVDSRRG